MKWGTSKIVAVVKNKLALQVVRSWTWSPSNVFGLVKKIKQRPKAVNFWHLVTYQSNFPNTGYYINLNIIYGSLRPVKGIHCRTGKRFSRPIRILFIYYKKRPSDWAYWSVSRFLFFSYVPYYLHLLGSCLANDDIYLCNVLFSYDRDSGSTPHLRILGGLGAVTRWQLTILLGTALKKRKTSSCCDICLVSVS